MWSNSKRRRGWDALALLKLNNRDKLSMLACRCDQNMYSAKWLLRTVPLLSLALELRKERFFLHIVYLVKVVIAVFVGLARDASFRLGQSLYFCEVFTAKGWASLIR